MSRQTALKARSNGERLEALIETSCAYYRNKGIAHIQKTPEPMKPIRAVNRSRGQYLSVFTKKAQPDFAGTLKGGRSVMFEAKHTEATNLPFDRISDVQTHDLTINTKLGAKCFVLVSFGFKNFYAIDWNEWLLLELGLGKKSVNESDLARYKVENRNGRLMFLGGR